MKKTLSVILALIMLMSSFVTAFAAEDTTAAEDIGDIGTYKECVCDDCTKADGCICCVFCPYLNEDYILQCVKVVDGPEGERHIVKCCANCTGLFPCDCGTKSDCGCATCDGKSIEVDDGLGDPLLTPEQQEEFVTGFQKIIKIIADAFTKFFDAIFEFLRIDEVL